jgi:hypothetical protein
MSINLKNINDEIISEFSKLKKRVDYLNEITILNIEIEDYEVSFVATKLKHLKCENEIFNIGSTFEFYNFIKSNKKNEFNKIEDMQGIINEVMNRLQYVNELIILKNKYFKEK